MNTEAAEKFLNMEPARFRYVELLCRDFLSIQGMGLERKYLPQDLRILEAANRLLQDGINPSSLKYQLLRTLSPQGQRNREHVFPGSRTRSKAVIFSISSGKGGVGKSTLALNLGVELHRTGQTVAIVDGDLGTANLHIMAGLRPGRTLKDVISGDCPIEDAICRIPGGPDIVPGCSGIAELANITGQRRDILLSELRRLEHRYDVVVIDTAAGVSAGVVDFTASSDFVLVVTSPEITAITDAYAMMKLTLERKAECKFALIANRVRSVSEGSSVLGRISKCAHRFLNRRVLELGFVWEDSNVRRAVNEGSPLAIQYPQSRASLAIRKLVQALEEKELVCPRPPACSSMSPAGGSVCATAGS